MCAVNAVIRQQLHSEVPLINQISEYIIGAGGKRIRLMLVLFMAKAYSYSGNNHHKLAAVIEFIHTATLLHDDIVDESSLRRGCQTANSLFGNATSVLVGDFLYSRAFQMMVSIKNDRVMKIIADATNIIAEGEVLQLLNMNNPDISEEQYLQVIRSKTAKLFEAAAQVGVLITGASNDVIKSAGEYGRSLGTAFQLTDDVLDYSGKITDIGKNTGDDLREGKPTMPLIYLMKHGCSQSKSMVRSCIENGDKKNFDKVLAAIQISGALDYTKNEAKKAAEKAASAISGFPNGLFKDSLLQLCSFAVERMH